MWELPERYWDASDPLKGVDYLEYEVEERARRELVYTSPNYDKWEEQHRKRVIMEDAKRYMKSENTESLRSKSTDIKKIKFHIHKFPPKE